MATKAVRERRERIVHEHMESENRLEFDVTMETFDHPRYELIGTGEVYDGEEEVWRYFREGRAAFPDQRNELISLHHADEAVIAEFWLRGTHEGSFRGLPATGRSFECRMTAFFLFEEDRLVCERVYFDVGTIMRQLRVAHDPASVTRRVATVATHPLPIARGFVRSLPRH